MLVIMILVSMLLTTNQVILKRGFQIAAQKGGGWQNYLKTWQIWLAMFLIGAMGIMWAMMLRKYDFSRVYPLISLSYVWSILVAKYYFREKITWNRYLGMVLIILGVVLINV
ncbi:MAG TPA: EamA family transporter [Candidatus Cloacimonadota bacterium]|nr:EamA family transporter [Candidatus Cloacimonadota bacterium]